VEFLSVFQCQAPLHKRKAPLLKTFRRRFWVATTSPPFCNEPHRSHVSFCEGCTWHDLYIWSQHHFVAIGNPISDKRAKLHTVAASSIKITLLLLVRATYIWVLFVARDIEEFLDTANSLFLSWKIFDKKLKNYINYCRPTQ